ncbi:hypothetical protein C2G38_2250408 [Gigaspora rosea]|uniref:Uncharacterized protein n=1 Tax=Gigaspora rosea TaxID=44941 RepID=A0A397ULJ7_9GLOM|nr:hypothetical protein C2G38_2250408 [Gigaspora rosea]
MEQDYICTAYLTMKRSKPRLILNYDSYYDSNYDYCYDYGGSYHTASHPTPTRKISKKPSGFNHSPSSYIEEISSPTNTLTTKPIKIEASDTPTKTTSIGVSYANYVSSSTSTAIAKPVPLFSDMLVKLNKSGEMISPFHQSPIGNGETGVTGELV